MRTIHWLGAGLSSRPGFERIRTWRDTKLTLWSRDPAKASAWCRGDDRVGSELFGWDALKCRLSPGDLVISMLPAPMHPNVARICLARGCDLVTTSYLSDAMRAMDPYVRAAGLRFVNEAGLDPGIDHLFAHELAARLEAHPACARVRRFRFTSVCGGFPLEPDSFRYRFSWSPLGVLRALRSSPCWIEDGAARRAERPWDAVRPYEFGGRPLEMYPNRDSLEFLESYGLLRFGDPEEFVRGTLRPQGWSGAWSEIFQRIESADEPALEALAGELERRYAYGPGERDRVCLDVRLSATDADGETVFDERLGLDETGTPDGGSTAMARTVSLSAAVGAREVLDARVPLGVTGIPSDTSGVRRWLAGLASAGIRVQAAEEGAIGGLTKKVVPWARSL